MKRSIYLVLMVFIFTFILCKSEYPVHRANNNFDSSGTYQKSEKIDHSMIIEPIIDVNENLSINHLDVFESKDGMLKMDSGKQRVELLGEYVSGSDHNHTLFTNLRVTNTDTNEIIVDRRIVDNSTGIPELFLADFTGDKLDEIMVVIHSGAIHDYEKEYQFYSLVNHNLISLPYEGLLDDESLSFSIENDKGKFHSKKLNVQYEVNLPEKLLELYKSGTELNPNKNYIFEPMYIETDGVYGLKGDLYIVDSGSKEFIARFEMIYKFKESKWVLVKLKLLKSN
ncbi:hypothetical protein GRF59_07060 [Paenibacillus sp. HJL G12]|uniref:Uncharacterized protein n=1 Tax=Paenibacillus dendrobii TaxID=2691084 RepID=A0A7X3IG92_9BACL|nr:hypothetical protein [Paenibacillus dendrobii]MWV43389.1 hypothetical protein [Paenibacillus dendrobii]